MTKFKTVALVAVAASITALVPTAALAKGGYVTCQLAKPENPGAARKFFTYPFAADSADEDAMTAKFQKMLMTMGRIDPTMQTTGGCHWEAKKSQAFAVVKGFLAHYPGNEFDLSRALELDGK